MNPRNYLKNIRYVLEFLIVKFGLWFFGMMSPQKASNVASAIAKFVGKKISVNKLAYKNLSSAMPELNEMEKEKIIDDMWDNLGRIVGEYVHISNCPIDGIEFLIEDMSQESRTNIEAVKKSGKGGIIFGAHIGNWEVGPKLFIKSGLKVSTVYRPLNNPYVEDLTARMRGVELIGKSTRGSRKIIEVIRNGGFVIILADQKISEGEPVKFFHDDAITTTSIARIGLKYNVPIIPARSIRLGKNFKFRVEVEKPLAFERTDDVNFDLLQLTRSINCKLEEWIRQYPSQWFWVHNRWKR
jgi:Kdo2-lipid IVA lauroyltransferase/acyltransferase